MAAQVDSDLGAGGLSKALVHGIVLCGCGVDGMVWTRGWIRFGLRSDSEALTLAQRRVTSLGGQRRLRELASKKQHSVREELDYEGQ